MEKALAAFHQAATQRDVVGLEYASDRAQVGLRIRCQARLVEAVLGPLTANYPECVLVEVDGDEGHSEYETWAVELRLMPELFPILRHGQFEDALNRNFADPISAILRAIRPEHSLTGRVEIQIAPASAARRQRAVQQLQDLTRPFFASHPTLAAYFLKWSGRGWRGLLARAIGWLAARSGEVSSQAALSTSTSRTHEREADLQAASDKLGGHLFETRIRLSISADQTQEQSARERLQALVGAFGAFTKSRLAVFEATPVRRGTLKPLRGRGFLMSHEELATLWHPPTSTVLAEAMQTTDFTELEAPRGNIYSGEEEGGVTLGRTRFRSDERLIGLSQEDRRRHLYIVGKTGMGKTTLLENLIVADLAAGRGVCLVDPHGDLATSISNKTPKHRTNDVIVFDAADREFAISFNPLACRDPALIDQVTSGIVSAMKKLYDSWGPRLEDTLRNAVFVTVEQGGTMLSLLRLLAEPAYRAQVVPKIEDDVVRSFWLHEFASWDDRYRTEAVAAIQNKIRPFLTSRTMRAIVSQPSHSIDLRQIMDSGKALIVNLSKGRVGEDNATLLGALLVTSLQQAALTRADIPEADRRDFFLYVDEFQNFATSSFATILSEARKYRLSLTIAHQYLSQLDDNTASAVFGNVGSIVSFQVGSDDAEQLAQQLSKHDGQLKQSDLTNLPKYTAYARLLIDGLPSKPFSMATLPPITNDLDPQRGDIVRQVSRRAYATPVRNLT